MSEHYNRQTQKQISLDNQIVIKGLLDKVKQLEETSIETGNDVKRILFYFNSDSTTNTEGLIEKNNRHDREIKDLKEVVVKGKVALWVTGFIAGLISSVITLFFKYK